MGGSRAATEAGVAMDFALHQFFMHHGHKFKTKVCGSALEISCGDVMISFFPTDNRGGDVKAVVEAFLALLPCPDCAKEKPK